MFETLIDLRGILSFIVVLFQVLGLVGLIVVGTSRIRNINSINKSVVLIIVGAIEVIYLAINERVFSVIFHLVGYYTYEILAMREALYGLVPNIISLITFGALFLYLGLRNRENLGKLLMISAIFWIVYGTILFVPYSIYVISYFTPLTLQVYQFASILILIASIFRIISSVFFMIYAFKIHVKVLLYSSILLVVASVLFFGNSLVLIFIYLI